MQSTEDLVYNIIEDIHVAVKAGHSETRLDAFETKGLRKILQVSWTAKKTNEWVLNKAGVK